MVKDILFRCSSLGHIMPGPKEGAEIAEGVKTHLVDVFVSSYYGRREEKESKYLTKGNEREEDSITLLNLHLGISKQLRKNKERFNNEYITGEPDVIFETKNGLETYDTKTCWSAFTFFRGKQKVDINHKWQGIGYMGLTGAKKHTVAYCLVNGTAEAIMTEKYYLGRRLGVIDQSNKTGDFLEKCKQIEINHIFDLQAFVRENPGFDFDNDLSKWTYDIPLKERVHLVSYERDEEQVKSVYERVERCRNWIKTNLLTH